MKLIEECYQEVILNEKLKAIRPTLTFKTVANDLKEEYEDYKKKHNIKVNYYGDDEPEKIIELLSYVVPMYASYERLFAEVVSDKKRIMGVYAIDSRWQNYYNSLNQPGLKAPAKLLFLKYLKQMGLDVPVELNAQGNPEYPFHLTNVYAQNKIIEEMVNKHKLDKATVEFLNNYINQRFQSKQVAMDINKWLRDSQKSTLPVETPIKPLTGSDKEAKIAAFIAKQKEAEQKKNANV